MIKRMIIGCVLALGMFASILPAEPLARDDISEFRACSRCGMDRKGYGYSRMLIVYKDGARAGVCSLHCAVIEMNEHKGDAPVSVLVADRNSHEMIEAEKAFWVVGGNRRGVMTKNPKWAFATGDAAKTFVASNGGRISSWNAVLALAREEAGR